MLGNVDSRKLRRGLVVALIVVLAGVVIDLVFSAPALTVGILLAAAALFALALLLMRGRV
jgi:FtsH-binding integral membrane protein